MKVLLRMLALLVAFAVVATALFVRRILMHHGPQIGLARHPLAIITFLRWAMILLIGPFAAIQLWRLKSSGRTATMILLATAMCYYLMGFLFFRAPSARPGMIVLSILCNATVFVFLCIRSVRKLCSVDHVHPHSGA